MLTVLSSREWSVLRVDPHRPHHPLWQTTLVDGRVHRNSVSVVFGTSVSFQPSVELEVAHRSEFLLGRSRAEPESPQFRRVWSVDQTICPSRRVVCVANLQQIIFNAAVPFSSERSVLSIVQHRSLLRAVSTSSCCSGWEKTLSMFLAFTLQRTEQRAIRRLDDRRVDGCLSGRSESWDFPRFFGLCGSHPAQKSELRADQMSPS